MEDKLDEILDSLKLETTQQTYPPYTETNKPQGIISISGKEEAKQSIQALINSAVREAREQGRSELWGATYNFLVSRDKELCEEWDELTIEEGIQC